MRKKSNSFKSELLVDYEDRLILISEICKDLELASAKLAKNKSATSNVSNTDIKIIILLTLNKYDYTAIFYLDFTHRKLVLLKTYRNSVNLTVEDYVFSDFDMKLIVESLGTKDWTDRELRMLHSAIKNLLN